MLFPLIPVPPFIFTLYFSSISWKRMTGAVKSRAVKVVDKEREGSKSVIVKGKEFSKEKRKTRGKMQVAKTFFFFFTSCSDVALDRREQVRGPRGKKRLSVWCSHILALLLLVCLNLSSSASVILPSPAAFLTMLIAAAYYLWTKRQEDMETTLAERQDLPARSDIFEGALTGCVLVSV